jgi:two-component system response regulator FixJ
MSAKILIIDDDDAVRDSTGALLESYGYEVALYPSAEEFLEAAAMEAACLLVDHNMPGMKGIDLLERLRRAGNQTPAVIITGCREPALETRAKSIGVAVLLKPLSQERLVSWIEGVVSA